MDNQNKPKKNFNKYILNPKGKKLFEIRAGGWKGFGKYLINVRVLDPNIKIHIVYHMQSYRELVQGLSWANNRLEAEIIMQKLEAKIRKLLKKAGYL